MTVAGIFAWSLTIFFLLSSSDAFIFKGSRYPLESSCLHRPSLSSTPLIKKDSVWIGELQRSLAVRGGGGNVKYVATLAELDAILATSGDAIVCIDFTATWCGPCQQIAPAFEMMSTELPDVVFLKVDVDENEETAQKYDVNQMPTFILIQRGEVVDQFSGANVAVLRQKLEGLVKGDGGAGVTAHAQVEDEEEQEEESDEGHDAKEEE